MKIILIYFALGPDAMLPISLKCANSRRMRIPFVCPSRFFSTIFATHFLSILPQLYCTAAVRARCPNDGRRVYKSRSYARRRDLAQQHLAGYARADSKCAFLTCKNQFVQMALAQWAAPAAASPNCMCISNGMRRTLRQNGKSFGFLFLLAAKRYIEEDAGFFKTDATAAIIWSGHV